MRIKDLQNEISLTIIQYKRLVDALEDGIQNPSIKEIYNRNLAIIETLQAVEDTLKGDRLALRIL